MSTAFGFSVRGTKLDRSESGGVAVSASNGEFQMRVAKPADDGDNNRLGNLSA
jgi:hypothetical protein